MIKRRIRDLAEEWWERLRVITTAARAYLLLKQHARVHVEFDVRLIIGPRVGRGRNLYWHQAIISNGHTPWRLYQSNSGVYILDYDIFPDDIETDLEEVVVAIIRNLNIEDSRSIRLGDIDG
jgi:hypothetical protein